VSYIAGLDIDGEGGVSAVAGKSFLIAIIEERQLTCVCCSLSGHSIVWVDVPLTSILYAHRLSQRATLDGKGMLTLALWVA
jgi:hypothetical protein